MRTVSQTYSLTPTLERLDPRVKFLCLILLGIQTFTLKASIGLIIQFLFLATIVVAAKLPARFYLRRLSAVWVFVLLAVCLNLVTVSGKVLFEVAGLYATREGLVQGTVLSSRLVLSVLAAAIFVHSTSIPDMADGADSVARLFGKRWKATAQVLTIALNFVPLLIQSARQIKKAHIARGANPGGNPVRQARFAMAATIPLFATALRSSDHLSIAMEARSYNPQSERSIYRQLQITKNDWLAIVVTVFQFMLSSVLTPSVTF